MKSRHKHVKNKLHEDASHQYSLGCHCRSMIYQYLPAKSDCKKKEKQKYNKGLEAELKHLLPSLVTIYTKENSHFRCNLLWRVR